MSSRRVYEQIKDWEEQRLNYEANDFEMIYASWLQDSFQQISPALQEKFFSRLDGWLFHTHAFLQGTNFQMEARERILTIGRIFENDIKQMNDMKKLNVDQLTYIADQQTARSRLYSFAQGGLTGTGGLFLLGMDFPLMLGMNLRTVQLVGLTFGHEMNHPYEMMLSLKVFHAATLPKRLQGAAWEHLIAEVRHNPSPYLYEGEDDLTGSTWIEHPLKQTFKSLFILMFRKKLFQGIPLVSVAIGAQSNYNLTKRISEFATKFYQYRHLIQQEGM
ncbi:EcsC family protein [Halobacillus sp. B23F22_1]|uniref:EcsC family protein n=1 Tax=Halobacillus sp. B23F22_1 TaxID=3459514 RepID=UPI00373F1BB1